MQGFQSPIKTDSFIVDGVGVLGNMHMERNLTYVEVALSGHMWVLSPLSHELLSYFSRIGFLNTLQRRVHRVYFPLLMP
jgi:hypothetical protein